VVVLDVRETISRSDGADVLMPNCRRFRPMSSGFQVIFETSLAVFAEAIEAVEELAEPVEAHVDTPGE
jgi:hypothetical protein